jgi:GNAT superfamily N-acetyltransferase
VRQYEVWKEEMRLKEFAPNPERDDNDDIPDRLVVLANRWWNATDRQPQIEHVLNSLGWSIHQVESEDDAVQLQHRDGTTYFISADDFDPDLFESQDFSTEDMIAYLRQHHDTNLHQDYLDHIKTFSKFVLKNIPVNTLKTELSGLDQAKVERYKQMDFSKAPPIVMGDGYILDGYHRAVAAKELGIPAIRAYVGVKGVSEIAKIPQGDFGDADTLRLPKYDIDKKELPGGAGFTYAVGRPNPEDLEIMIFDGDTLAAELDLFYTRDATDAWRVNTIAVDPKYRNRGLGKALYGIALSILRLTLEAGDTQTQHGQRMWLMLNSIPGVEVVGYNMERTGQYRPRPGDEIVAQDDDWTRYTFPVKPGVNSMRSGRRGTGMYTSQASMLARWRGQ